MCFPKRNEFIGNMYVNEDDQYYRFRHFYIRENVSEINDEEEFEIGDESDLERGDESDLERGVESDLERSSINGYAIGDMNNSEIGDINIYEIDDENNFVDYAARYMDYHSDEDDEDEDEDDEDEDIILIDEYIGDNMNNVSDYLEEFMKKEYDNANIKKNLKRLIQYLKFLEDSIIDIELFEYIYTFREYMKQIYMSIDSQEEFMKEVNDNIEWIKKVIQQQSVFIDKYTDTLLYLCSKYCSLCLKQQ